MKLGVLVVDPDQAFVEDLRRRMLLETVMEIRDVAQNGMEALTKAPQLRPDILLTSVQLPDMGASQLVQNLKMMNPSLKVLALYTDQIDPALGPLGVLLFPKMMGGERIIEQLRQLATSTPSSVGVGSTPPWGAPPQGMGGFPQGQGLPPFQGQGFPSGQGPSPYPQGQGFPYPQGPCPQGSGQGLEGLMGQGGGFRTIRQTIIAVWSPKGGIGKSSVAKELAVLFSRADLNGKPLRVLVVDADLDFGDIGALYRVEAQFPNITAWTQDIEQKLRFDPSGQSIRYSEEQIKKYLVPSPKYRNVHLLLAPPNHADALDITGKHMEVILENIKASDAFDVVILDCGPNTKDYTLTALDKANIVLFITNQEYAAINDCYLAVKTLRSIQFPMNKMQLVINQYKPNAGFHTAEEISHALGVSLIGTLPDVGSQKMATINNRGDAVSIKDTDLYTQHLRQIAHKILPVFQRKVTGAKKSNEKGEAKKGLFSFFKR